MTRDGAVNGTMRKSSFEPLRSSIITTQLLIATAIGFGSLQPLVSEYGILRNETADFSLTAAARCQPRDRR